MDKYVCGIPKCELHVHIEGTFEPELIFALAQRNRVALKYQSIDEIRGAYNFTNLQTFLDIYYEACSVLVTEADFFDLAYAYAERAARDNVKVAEVFFDPQSHTPRGVPFATVVKGLSNAFAKAKTELGFDGRLIMCFLRHLSPEEAMTTLLESLPYKHLIVGVGLDSSEKDRPPSLFRNVYARAIAEGYAPVAHAGEEGPPEYIIEALDVLHCKRIDHGVAAINDPKLVQRLAQEKIGLTMCPFSNIKLCVYKSLEDHPLKKLLDAGCMVTVNSDDPAYFGGYINENFMAVCWALDLTKDDVKRLCENAFGVAFLTSAEKEAWLQTIADYHRDFE